MSEHRSRLRASISRWANQDREEAKELRTRAEKAGLVTIEDAPDRYDFDQTPVLRRRIAETFATRTQAEWSEVFEGTDACVAPILPLSQAMDHAHMAAREVFVDREGVRQPQPAPRFSRTAASLSSPPPIKPGIDTREALAAWGIADVDALIDRGVAVQA